MKITCPHCGLAGNIGEDKLKASSGSVRCPRCHKAFTPEATKASGGKDISSRTGGDLPGKKAAKNAPVLFGARSGQDIPFTKIMETSEPVSEDDITIELGAADADDISSRIDAEEIVPLGDDEMLSMKYTATDPGQMGNGAAGDFTGETVRQTPDYIPGPLPAGITEKESAVKAPTAPAAPTAPTSLGRIFGRGPKGPIVAGSPAPAPRKAGIRKGFILFFIIVLALWGGYRFFSIYWPPYAQEKEFLADSRTLFDKYHELRVYLKVGLPDPVFATKVAEAAYVWEVYREKHESDYRKDPLFASLMIMGRLFLAVKELLDRDMYPDNYLGLEWGEGFPFPTKEEYVNAMVAGIPICINATEENFVFSKKVLDSVDGLSFISAAATDILNLPRGPSRADYASDLKRTNKTFLALDSQMPVLINAIADVREIINDLPGK